MDSASTRPLCAKFIQEPKHGGETFDAPTDWMNRHSSDEQDKCEQENAPYLKLKSDKKLKKLGI